MPRGISNVKKIVPQKKLTVEELWDQTKDQLAKAQADLLEAKKVNTAQATKYGLLQNRVTYLQSAYDQLNVVVQQDRKDAANG